MNIYIYIHRITGVEGRPELIIEGEYGGIIIYLLKFNR